MRILIVSDTHRRNDTFNKALEKVKPIDMLIHCGDTEGSELMLAGEAGCPAKIVAGNNDFFSDLPREEEFMLGKYRVWLTHGHNFYVSMDNETIKEEAVSRGCDIVMYGHTHKPLVQIEENIIAVNPGSLTYPRQEGRRPSYIMMEIDNGGEAHFNICYL